MNKTEKNIFPLSPQEMGGISALHDMHCFDVGGTTEQAGISIMVHYLTLSEEDLARKGLHTALVGRSDFLGAVLEMTRIQVNLQAIMDRDPEWQAMQGAK